MSRYCTVCAHPQHEAVDLALALHVRGYRDMERMFGLDKSTLHRHERNCLKSSWAKAREVNAMLRTETLLEEISAWHARMLDQYGHADAAGNIMGAVATARTGIQAIESFGKITEQHDLQARLAQLEQMVADALAVPVETADEATDGDQ